MNKIRVAGSIPLMVALATTLKENGLSPYGSHTDRSISENKGFIDIFNQTNGGLTYFYSSYQTKDHQIVNFNLPDDWNSLLNLIDVLKKSPKYAFGETLVVRNNLESYTTRERTFKDLGFKNKKENKYWKDGTRGVVFNIGIINENNYVVYALRNENGTECLVGEEGVCNIDEYLGERIVLLENSKREIKIDKKGIYYKDTKFEYIDIRTMYNNLIKYSQTYCYDMTINIGCIDRITITDLKNIMDTYNDLTR